ncbi:MAG: cell division/cell wall cluster transcriptional repressor MraZ [Prevotellaceae bacterium]|jgi:MraZ protein|nr:cell division/cell wall cluster transcriptional repressor MraZ [Prevotellaceae bacterium]
MSTYIGSIKSKIDAKGRVALPAAYRRLLPEDSRERLVARLDLTNACLVLYPEHIWNVKMEELRRQMDDWSDDLMLLSQYTSLADWVDIDGQGRILLTRRVQQAIGLQSEALFVGMIDRIAIWDAERYEAAKLPADEFAQRLKEKMCRKTS